MFVVMRTVTVKEGTSHRVVENFSRPGAVEQQPGFVDIQVLLKDVRRGEEPPDHVLSRSRATLRIKCKQMNFSRNL